MVRCGKRNINEPDSPSNLVSFQVRVICSLLSSISLSWHEKHIRLSKKVRIVVMMRGTRLRSCRALASKSTPNVCSAAQVSRLKLCSTCLHPFTINLIIVIVVDLDLGNETTSTIILEQVSQVTQRLHRFLVQHHVVNSAL